MGTEKLYPNRDEVRDAADCPRCGAEAGWNCVGVRGKTRESNHRERVEAAEMVWGRERSAWAKQAIEAMRAKEAM